VTAPAPGEQHDGERDGHSLASCNFTRERGEHVHYGRVVRQPGMSMVAVLVKPMDRSAMSFRPFAQAWQRSRFRAVGAASAPCVWRVR
jgi:hypothetical protein